MRPKYLLSALLLPALILLSACGSDQSQQTRLPLQAVFIGSSQTSHWGLSVNYPNNKFINKGVSGDLSADMILRFKRDAIDPHPKAVLIWAGENDIERGVPLSQLQANIDQMRKEANAAGLGVVLATLAPKVAAQSNQNAMVVVFNDWLREYAFANGIRLADLYVVLVDNSGSLKPAYADGAEHLTPAAYQAISPVALQALNPIIQ